MDSLARKHLTERRDHAARQAEGSRVSIQDVFSRNPDSTHPMTVSDWAVIARTAVEGAHYAAQAEAFSNALATMPSTTPTTPTTTPPREYP